MDDTLKLIFILFIVYQFKHFISDFPLQTPYMLKKKGSPKWDFFMPLMTHASVHALFTLVICLVVRPKLWWLFFFDLIIHFFVDRWKSGPKYLGRYRDQKSAIYWIILGADQMIHHLTHILIIYLLVFY